MILGTMEKKKKLFCMHKYWVAGAYVCEIAYTISTQGLDPSFTPLLRT